MDDTSGRLKVFLKLIYWVKLFHLLRNCYPVALVRIILNRAITCPHVCSFIAHCAISGWLCTNVSLDRSGRDIMKYRLAEARRSRLLSRMSIWRPHWLSLTYYKCWQYVFWLSVEYLLACARLPDYHLLLCWLCLYDDETLPRCHSNFLQHPSLHPENQTNVPE